MPYLRAATDVPFGAMPYDGVLRVTPYNKDAAAVRVFVGDFMTLEADGSVAVAAAGDRLLGVAAMGSAASTAEANLLIYDHPDQLFVVQNDDSGVATAQTNVGNNADIVATTGDTTTERSLHEVSQTGWGTVSAQLKLMRLHPIETAFGSNRKVVVRIAEHIYGTGSETGV